MANYQVLGGVHLPDVSPPSRISVSQALHRVVRKYADKNADWGPRALLRKFRKVARILFLHPVVFYRAVDTLAGRKFSSLVTRDPFIFLKCCLESYSRDLLPVERAKMFVAHYHWLQSQFDQGFLDRIVADGGEVVWERREEGLALGISLHIAYATEVSGEMVLSFRANGIVIYALYFQVVPGRPFGVNADRIMLVSQLHGMKGQLDLIRRATKALSDVSPNLVLMAAADGFARGLDIEHVLGINAGMSMCGGDSPKPLLCSYDDFWSSIEGKRLPSGYFHFPVPLPVKPLQLIKRNHRGRVKIRRMFRHQVTQHVRNKVLRARAF